MSEQIPDARAVAEVVARLLKRMKPILAGQPMHVQAALLGEALAIFLAGYPDYMRDDMLANHVAYVQGLIPEVELEIFGGRRHPSNAGRLQ